jgi:hypothetical protein
MAATTSVPVTLDTPIAIKILFRGQTRKLKLPLKDLGAHVLPLKVRSPCCKPASLTLLLLPQHVANPCCTAPCWPASP